MNVYSTCSHCSRSVNLSTTPAAVQFEGDTDCAHNFVVKSVAVTPAQGFLSQLLQFVERRFFSRVWPAIHAGPHEFIRFHNQQNVLRCQLPCLQNGRDKSRCVLLLRSVVNLLDAAPVIRDSMNRIHDSNTFLPGDYFVDSDLTITWSIRDVTPFGDIGYPFPDDQIDNLVFDALDSCTRTTNFRFELAQRDHVCVLSGKSHGVIGSHILAHAWFQNGGNRIGRLPDNVVPRICALPKGINDVRNGLMLSADLSAAFDEGFFTIALNASNQYEVVALDSLYLNFDGYRLYAGRARDNGGDMDPMLLKFHTSTSVLRNAIVEEGIPNASVLDVRMKLKLADIKQMVLASKVHGCELVAEYLTWDMVERFLTKKCIQTTTDGNSDN